MTNRKMFFTMLWGAVFRRRSRAMMAVIASLVGAATLFCLASVCVAVPQQMNEEMQRVRREPDRHARVRNGQIARHRYCNRTQRDGAHRRRTQREISRIPV